jgi:hypothetical protein
MGVTLSTLILACTCLKIATKSKVSFEDSVDLLSLQCCPMFAVSLIVVSHVFLSPRVVLIVYKFNYYAKRFVSE